MLLFTPKKADWLLGIGITVLVKDIEGRCRYNYWEVVGVGMGVEIGSGHTG